MLTIVAKELDDENLPADILSFYRSFPAHQEDHFSSGNCSSCQFIQANVNLYMKPIVTLSFVALVVFGSLSFSFCRHNPERKNHTPGFAVVELFTSEGCSSCPPADEVMIRLAKEFPADVYFLGYHVDYWDYIGWKDVYSKAEHTEKQRKYSDVFGLNSIYTPQAVINGRKELVGSKENQLRAIIQQELKDSAISSVQIEAKKAGENKLVVSYKITRAEKSDVTIALVQLKAVSNVKRGENRGHKLEHINVVRDMRTISVNKDANGTVGIMLPAGLTSKDVKLIVFVQDKNSLRITAAAETMIKE